MYSLKSLKDRYAHLKGEYKAPFSSLLPYFGLVGEGLLGNRDGSFCFGIGYKGADMDSWTDEEINSFYCGLNTVFSGFGDGWCLHWENLRWRAHHPKMGGDFPQKVSAFIEAERSKTFSSVSPFFREDRALIFTYAPSGIGKWGLSRFLIGSSSSGTDSKPLYSEQVAAFKESVKDKFSLFKNVLPKAKLLGSDELLSVIRQCICGEPYPFKSKKDQLYLNHSLGFHHIRKAFFPVIDEERYLGVVSIDSFPEESRHDHFKALRSLPFELRISARFIFLGDGQEKALADMKSHHLTRTYGPGDMLSEMISRGSSAENRMGSQSAEYVFEVEEASKSTQRGHAQFGYFTYNVIIFEKDLGLLEEKLAEVKKTINATGFRARVEKLGAFEAYLGSLPGIRAADVTRPIVSTENLAHLIGLTSPWLGSDTRSEPIGKSQTLFLCSGPEGQVFKFTNFSSDVGHTLILGPTGSGKSTLLNLIVGQSYRHEGAQTFIFEKGRSAEALVNALGGQYYNPLANKTLAFAPLKSLETEADKAWAHQWLVDLVMLQGVEMTPKKSIALTEALKRLQNDPRKTLSCLYQKLQDVELQQAVSTFTKVGSGILSELLDAEEDGLREANCTALGFDVSELLQQKPRIAAPVLMYLFRWVEKRLDGRPTLIVLDEAWLMLSHPLFSEKIVDWLRTLRKANAWVAFATQSIADVSESPIRSILVESCPTKIFLPNPEAHTEIGRQFYKTMGLNEPQTELISRSTPKRDYYVVKPEGSQLVSLELTQGQLAFLGASSPQKLRKIRELREKHEADWPSYWLVKNGLTEEAKFF